MLTGGQAAAFALLALEVPGAVELLEVGLEPADAPLDPPAIDLELRLTAAEAGADAAALLSELGLGAATQAGQAVAQQGELDLGAALERARVLGEDVEDDRGAVDGRPAEQLLQVVLLRRGELVVEHDRVGVDLVAQVAELLGLALADEPRVVGWSRRWTRRADLVGAGRVDQCGELVEAGVGVFFGGVGERHPDEDDALPDRAVDEGGAERFVVRVGHGLGYSIVATYVVGPVSVTLAGAWGSPLATKPTLALPPSMWTVSFPSASAAKPHRHAATAAAHAPVPHACVMPAPRSCTRIVIALGPGPASMISRLTCGTLAPSVSQVDGEYVVDGHDGVRVAEAQVRHRSAGVGAERRPPGGLVDLGDLAHVDGGEPGGRVVGRHHLDGAQTRRRC